ncbi:RHS repeat domain-containing protein [Roseateles chitinivorans]|uniref:RHS repeat domain-containing protein n=1 Tax=Roseateles chitinivorans TaxID=2917965 RepID=UPI003D67EA75
MSASVDRMPVIDHQRSSGRARPRLPHLLREAGLVLAGAVALQVSAASLVVPEQVVTRTTTFGYDPVTGQLKSKVEQDGDARQKVSVDYDYTTEGNRKIETVVGWAGGAAGNLSTRIAKVEWTADARFPKLNTNAKSHAETVEYDDRFGLMVKRIDPNGWKTVWEYDAFGRKRFERRGYASKDATAYTDYTEWRYEACGSSCPTVEGVPARMVVTTLIKGSDDQQLGPVVKSFVNELGQEIRSESQVPDGDGEKTVYRDTVYDGRGNVQRRSQPYFSGATASWTWFDHDELGRKISETSPQSTLTRYDRVGTSTTTTVSMAGEPRTQLTTVNGQGQIVSTTDAKGSSTAYAYDAGGNLIRTLNPYGDVVEVTYDARGRRTGLKDPDLGNWSFAPNAFGELTSQTNALGKTSTMSYDELGRLTSRREGDLNSWFNYDATNGIGRLDRTWSDNGYCRTVVYDGLSRPTTTDLRIGSGAQACDQASEHFATTVVYDGYGRVERQTYPTQFTVKQVRHATLGTPMKVVRWVGGAEGAVYWTRGTVDAASRSTKFTYGNGVETYIDFDTAGMGWIGKVRAGTGNAVQYSEYVRNEVGQVKSRTDSFDVPQGLSELVDIDGLGRPRAYYLRPWSDPNGEVAGTRVSVDYDAIGRIKSKSDVGTYFYARPADLRPHAVTAVRGTVQADYDYDAAGQMVVRSFGDQLYTDAGLLRMAGGARACHEFLYQGEGMRVQQLIFGSGCRASNGQPSNGSSPVSRTVYMHPDAANGLSYERETRGGTVLHKQYLTVDGHVVALVQTDGTGVPVATSYLHYDHLGSVVAVTDGAGSVVERRSFDPWGRPRDTTGPVRADSDLPGGLAAATDRGYTLHEHLEGSGLIHMNGRAYDPVLGRFTSGDPMVQSPYDLQNYDRYAYVMNQPLDLTDPTGFADDGGGFSFGFGFSAETGSRMFSAVVNYAWGGGGSAGNNGQTDRGAQPTNGQMASKAYPNVMPSQDGYGAKQSGPQMSQGEILIQRAFAGSCSLAQQGCGDAKEAVFQRWLHTPEPTLGTVSPEMEALAVARVAEGLRLGAVAIRASWAARLEAQAAAAMSEEVAYLYRGVPAGHPALRAAKQGRVEPGNVSGTVTPEAHNLGGQAANSPFTSWTRDPSIAATHAAKNGPGGVVLRLPQGAPPPGAKWGWEWSPDVWGESEVLLRGTRIGAQVMK